MIEQEIGIAMPEGKSDGMMYRSQVRAFEKLKELFGRALGEND